MEIIVDHFIRIRIKDLPADVINSLKDKFEYNNPKYVENNKYGYSNYGVPKYLYSFKEDGNSGIITFSRGCLKYVLRQLAIRGIQYTLNDKTITLRKVNFDFKETKARPEQNEFINTLIKAKQGIGIAYTSFGKTFSCLQAMKKLGQPTLICVHTEFLQKQWIKEAHDLFGIPMSDIGGVGGVFADNPTVRNFNVCLYHSLSKPAYLKKFRNKVGLVIQDECLSPDTLISTPEGFKKLGDIKIGDCVISPEGNPIKVTNKWEKEVEAFEYTLKDGIKITASKDHKVSTRVFKYKKEELKHSNLEVRELSKCENITSFQVPTRTEVDPPENELIGWYLSDGLVKGNRICFGFKKEEKTKYLKELLSKLCIDYKESIDTAGVNNITFYKPDFFGCVAIKRDRFKEIPHDLFMSRSLNVLKGLFDGDGTFTGSYAEFDSTSERLVDQICDILRGSGIQAAKYTYERKNIKHNTIFRIIIKGKDLHAFSQLVNFRVKSKKDKLSKYLERVKYQNPHKKILAVKPLGKQRLIDITVDSDNHLFVANGLVVSNCQKSAIEAVQDCINYFPAKYRWGVSANHKRKDGKEFLVEDSFGEIVYRAEETDSDSKILSNLYLVPTTYYDFEYEQNKNYSGLITRMSRDKQRNILILKRCLRKLEQGRQVMILVERKEQACLLTSALRKRGIKTALLIGKVSKADIKKFETTSAKKIALEYDDKKSYDYVKKYAERREIDVVIGTQKAEVGLSVRTLGHLVVTTPMGSNVEDRLMQIIGRVERTHGKELEKKFGKKPRPTVDILVDDRFKSFQKHKKKIKDVFGDRCFIVKRK